MRIVSLLPSATEMICALGLDEQLVGVTHECDFPPYVRRLPRVTRTLIPSDAPSGEIDALVSARLADRNALYSLDLPMLESLRPDLIVTQALCDVCAVAEAEVAAAACGLPGRPRVLNLEPTCLDEVFSAIQTVAGAAGVSGRGNEVVGALRRRIGAVVQRTHPLVPMSIVLLEWIDPPFSCGHWSPELVRMAGGVERIGRAGERSRAILWDEVVSANPDALVIACCGFDVSRTRADLPRLRGYAGFDGLAAARNGRIFLADGNAYFSRPGPRLVESVELLAEALHPELGPIGETDGRVPFERIA